MGSLVASFALIIGYLVMLLAGVSLAAVTIWQVCSLVLNAGRTLVMTRDFYEYRRDRKARALQKDPT